MREELVSLLFGRLQPSMFLADEVVMGSACVWKLRASRNSPEVTLGRI